MPVRRLIAAVATAAAIAGCGGDGEDLPEGAAHPVLYGFNDNSVRFGQQTPERAAELAALAGAEVIRLTLDWRFAERAPGAYDFAIYDRIYDTLLAEGIRPLWSVMFSPRWAWDPGATCPNNECRYPPAESRMREWGRFVAEIARRYPRSAGIEVWNEPNLVNFWQPAPDPARFTRLVKAAHRAVERVDEDMPVVMGGLSNRQQTDDGGMAMAEFLRAAYDAGLRGNTDAIVFHPYPANRDDPVFERSVAQVLEERERAGDARTPLWVDELGATTGGPDPALRWTPQQQAEVLATSYKRLIRVPGVEMVLIHTLVDPPGALGSAEAGYGLIDQAGEPRPAWCAMAKATGASECPGVD